MPNTEKPFNNSSDLSSDASQNLVSSRHRRDDSPAAEGKIRERAYELYVERGRQPSDGFTDWLQAEREYYDRP